MLSGSPLPSFQQCCGTGLLKTNKPNQPNKLIVRLAGKGGRGTEELKSSPLVSMRVECPSGPGVGSAAHRVVKQKVVSFRTNPLCSCKVLPPPHTHPPRFFAGCMHLFGENYVLPRALELVTSKSLVK